MERQYILALIFTSLTLIGSGLAGADSLELRNQHFHFYLEDEPIYTSDSEASPGFMSEVADLLLERLGASATKTFLPWNRAQVMTRNTPEAVIFPLSRTAKREHDYQWICKIIDVPVAFVSKIGNGVPVIRSFEYARGIRGIGVIQGTPQEARLRSLDIPYVALVGKDLYVALQEDKIRAVYTAIPEAVVGWRIAGYQERLSFGPALQTLPLWIATSKRSTQIDPNAWLDALKEIKSSGQFGQIYQRYFGEEYQ